MSEETENQPETIIVGLSGPSSSGKTTLARLLRTAFSVHGMKTFIIHEDDFYLPDDRIPYTTTPSGKVVQDWDTVEAINVPLLASTLAYVRRHGALPPELPSKEDQNDATHSGVDDATLEKIHTEIERKLDGLVGVGSGSGKGNGKLTIAFLEGFLLFAPPKSEQPDHILRVIHENIHLHLFLPAPYDIVKSRREKRSGYVTSGPAPPPVSQDQIREQDSEKKQTSKAQSKEEADQRNHETDVRDMETPEQHQPPQNFWTDPPGYVDDIVWPRYVRDHAWLLLPEPGKEGEVGSDETETKIKRIGNGANVRTDAGVAVAPGNGTWPMSQVLEWAVDKVSKFLEEKQGRA
ncbi:hypothetical protein DTO271D3_7068 [Paecilomyces variotii]|nr:hypothetical protein DTO212C5_3075 [Paecilomyces variotii]KAJ9312677.1 hypothetical protein DTO271D3_7068 [Paecilomyces variotii]KAJ9324340.1 hypothetical protein DTO027B3_4626 [Paecilomyces variotii]KAJ9334068.1 hypothetical protein DTO027B5_4191 [Paecilomyces variotii]KAJ9353946.1 hypothetical protein DTO280E4_7101 [Paecilomyces variotii]